MAIEKKRRKRFLNFKNIFVASYRPNDYYYIILMGILNKGQKLRRSIYNGVENYKRDDIYDYVY